MKNKGDVNRTLSGVSRSADFKQADFDEAVRIYNLTKK